MRRRQPAWTIGTKLDRPSNLSSSFAAPHFVIPAPHLFVPAKAGIQGRGGPHSRRGSNSAWSRFRHEPATPTTIALATTAERIKRNVALGLVPSLGLGASRPDGSGANDYRPKTRRQIPNPRRRPAPVDECQRSGAAIAPCTTPTSRLPPPASRQLPTHRLRRRLPGQDR